MHVALLAKMAARTTTAQGMIDVVDKSHHHLAWNVDIVSIRVERTFLHLKHRP